MSSAGSVKTGEKRYKPCTREPGLWSRAWGGGVGGMECTVLAAGSDTSALVPRRQHGWGIALGARLTGTRHPYLFFVGPRGGRIFRLSRHRIR